MKNSFLRILTAGVVGVMSAGGGEASGASDDPRYAATPIGAAQNTQQTGAAEQWVTDAGRALRTSGVRGVILDLDTRPGQPVVVDVPLGKSVRRLVMTPHSVHGPHYQVLIHEPDGHLTAKAPEPDATLRGWIDGEEGGGSVAAGGMMEEGLFATVILADGERYWIEPAARLMRDGGGVTAPRGAHVIYRGEDSTDRSVVCTTNDQSVPVTGDTTGGFSPRGLTKRVAQLAVDAEFRFYSIFGGAGRTSAMVNILVNIINVQFEREVDITHQISSLIIRTTQLYDPNSGVDYLNQMTTHWNANHAGVVRDMAIMIHAQGNGGSAWTGQVCNLPSSYSANGIERGGLAFGCNLIAHEMGHSWNACHCPCNIPPFTMDPVANNSNRFAGSGPSDCGPVSVDQIVAFRNSRPCLTSTSSTHVIPNDDCAAAVRLFANPEGTGWGDTFGYSTIGANTDGPVSTCRPSSGGDIWYRLVAPCNGTMFISTCASGGANFDTVLTAYSPGAPCPPSQNFQIACSDNDPSCTTPATGSRITFSTTIGQEYLVRVAGSGFPAQTGLGILTIQHTGCPRPANDSCPFATTIQPGVDVPFSTIGATTGARVEGGTNNPHDSFLECLNAGDEQVASDIWYIVRAPCSGQLRISTCGSDFDTKIAVYTGTTCPTADRAALACNDDFSSCGLDSQVTINASNQAQFLIRVGGYNGIEGAGTLRVDALNCAPPFYNICQGAATLLGQSGSAVSPMAGAIAESTTSCTGGTRPDVWFYYTPPCDGTFTFNTCGTSFMSFPTTISFHTGCPGTEANRIACGASGTGCHGSPPPPDASASVSATAGQGFYIRVAALASTPLPYPSSLQYQFTFTAPASANDACAGAIPLANGTTLCTAGATPSPEGQGVCGVANSRDVWYSYTAGCTGTATITMCPTGFDPHITVFSGNSCSPLGAMVVCNDTMPSCDGFGSQVSFPTAAGQQFLVRIAVEGAGGTGGPGTISLMCIPTTNFNGACCIGANCTIRSIGSCNLSGGTFRGFGSVCTPNPCAPPACPADINQSGTLSVQDIFDFLSLYFSGNRRADFNLSGDVTVQDIFDYLAAYFTGCRF